MKVKVNTERIRSCNECYKDKTKCSEDFFDIEVGIFVSTICSDCLNKLRKMINDTAENVDNMKD